MWEKFEPDRDWNLMYKIGISLQPKIMISFTVISWTVSLPSVLGYPIDRNR